MKKVFAILMVLILAMSLMVGCGEQGEESTGDAAMKVGFIFIGAINDGGYTQAHYEGMMNMQDYFEGQVETVYIENVNDGDIQASKDAALNLIDQGCSVVVGCSFGFGDAMKELADSGDYDDVYFLHFSGAYENGKNMGNFFGAMEEPRYLTGMVAGEMTDSNLIGYVGAYPYTEVQIGIDAFTLGVQAVNPDAVVKVVYINSWGDPELEKTAAEQLLAAGCDVITQHVDSTAPQIAAADAGAYAIPYNYPNAVREEAYLTAPVWHHEVYLIEQIESILGGNGISEYSYYGDMTTGYIELADMSELVPQEVQDTVLAKKQEMEAGTFKVFSGPIEMADGTMLCNEGETLDRAGIWSITGLVKGTESNEL